MVMELAEGDLHSYLRDMRHLPEGQARWLFQQVHSSLILKTVQNAPSKLTPVCTEQEVQASAASQRPDALTHAQARLQKLLMCADHLCHLLLPPL